MKKKEWIIIGGAVGVILLSGIYFFKDEVQVDVVQQVAEEKRTQDIERNESEIYIYNFLESPQNLDWSEDQFLKMDNDSLSAGVGNFTIDVQQLTFEKQEVIDREKVYINDEMVDSFIVLANLSETRDLIFIEDEDHRGIYRYNYAIRDIRKVTEAMKCDEENVPYIKMSDDKSKFLYVEDGRNRLVAYNFKNGYKTILSRYYEDDDMNDFYQRFDITSNGGYIVDNDYENSEISIMGADSGRYYANKVIGEMPIINDKVTFMNYIYTNKNGEKMLGQLDFNGQKIHYMKLDAPIVTESIRAMGDSIIYMTAEEDSETYKLKKYNYKLLKEETLTTLSKSAINFSDAIEYMGLNGFYIIQDDDKAYLTNVENGETVRYDLLQSFELNGNEDYIHAFADGIILRRFDKFCVINQEGYQYIFETHDEIESVYTSINDQYLLIVSHEDPDLDKSLKMTVVEANN